jgi:hypothetical protein
VVEEDVEDVEVVLLEVVVELFVVVDDVLVMMT